MPQITAKIVFKLPFSIIRNREDGNKPQCIKTGSEEIIVYPPEKYILSLPEETLWSPDHEEVMGKPNDEPVWKADCTTVYIRKDFSAIPITGEEQKALVVVARDIIYRLLTMYRWQGRQLQVNANNIEGFNYDLRYFDSANKRIKAGPGSTKGGVVINIPPMIQEIIGWDDICQYLVSEVEPELYESLLLDAWGAVFNEPRRAVLDAATACEVFIENFCETARKGSPKVDPIIYSALQQSKKREGEVLFYFHEMLSYLFGHSLKADKQDLYEKLYYLCKTNNFVKHEGKCQYKEKGKKGKIKKVNAPEAREFISAVEEAIKYTKSLVGEP
ncbi:hypothetical protein ES708_27604 [subsurface metagenome]